MIGKKTSVFYTIGIFFFFLFFSFLAYSQETRFFMPKEISRAYNNQTRSFDGRPGPEYWQNTANYLIDVFIIPDSLMIEGEESVTYQNNSPDPLNELIIRLYHDTFRKANPRSSRVRSSDITEGVVLSKLIIDGDTLDISDNRIAARRGTNLVVSLPKQILPGGVTKVQIAWSQKIPQTTIRTGAYDSTSYFMAYWYPQIAVYDDIFGWDRLAYDFSTEFYNNLGNYDVTIHAPSHFTVLSTGVLQNAHEVLAPVQLDRYAQAKNSTTPVTIIGPQDLESGITHSGSRWHYKAENVPDFAFGLSDHYCWEAAIQRIEDRDVLIHTFYDVALFESAKEVTANQQKMMDHFSKDAPGIPYPYPEFTTFITGRSGGGMEYPMMANNGGPGLGVTVHEMFHTYFPMYVRVNEKRFAWMDEGWADFMTSWVITRYFQEDDTTRLFNGYSYIEGSLGSFSDLPLITSTQYMDNSNYGFASYPLPAFVYSLLHQHLGDRLFLECLREYIRRWAYKSPTPYDFMYTFENVSGQDLSWFWKPWFFEFGTVDVAIDSYKKNQLTLINKGSRPVPVEIQFVKENGEIFEMIVSGQAWNNTRQLKLKVPKKKNVKTVSVNRQLPDADILNNYDPPLSDRYGDFVITDAILGTYRLNQFPVDAVITEKNKMLYLDLVGAGLTTYLLPEKDLLFKSIDGTLSIEFDQVQGAFTGLTLKVFNITATASKM